MAGESRKYDTLKQALDARGVSTTDQAIIERVIRNVGKLVGAPYKIRNAQPGSNGLFKATEVYFGGRSKIGAYIHDKYIDIANDTFEDAGRLAGLRTVEPRFESPGGTRGATMGRHPLSEYQGARLGASAPKVVNWPSCTNCGELNPPTAKACGRCETPLV